MASVPTIWRTPLLAWPLATKSAKPQRVLAWAKRTRNVDGLVATYVRSSLLAGHYDNVFAAGERWRRHDIDRDVLAALCFEGLAPATKPKLKACKHPAIRCWAVLNGGGAPRKLATDRDLSRFFDEDNRSDPTLALAMRGVLYDVFFAALADALSGSKALGWAKIPETAEAHVAWQSRASTGECGNKDRGRMEEIATVAHRSGCLRLSDT